MANTETTTVRGALTSVLPREKVESEARRTGAVKRRRNVDIFSLVCTLVLGFLRSV